MNTQEKITLSPTRRLNKAERTVFERVNSEFIHLTTSDAEQLTAYAETVVRYEIALKSTKKNATISVPVVNRSTGNVTGEKIIRNPAFATLKEAQSQMVALARRLMIDAHSAEKRQRLLTKKSRAMIAAEQKQAADSASIADIDESAVQAKIDELRTVYTEATEDTLRTLAEWHFTVFLPSCDDADLDLYAT